MNTIMRTFKTKNFKVVVDALEDYDVDLSFDETGEVLRDLESGRLISFCARVRVFLHGSEIAEDFLGGCIYKSFEDFMDHKECGKQNREWEAKGEKGRCGSYFHDMIKTACDNARQHVAELQSVKVRA